MDRQLEILIKLQAELEGAKSADEALQKVREAIKGVKDESSEYDAWLKKNAASLGAVSQAAATATAEAERYQQVLEQMAQRQILDKSEKFVGQKWVQTAAAGAADLGRTMDELRRNVLPATEALTQQEVKAQDLGRAVSILGQSAGLAGGLIRAAFSSPVIAGAVALAVGIRKLISLYDEWKAKIKEAADIQVAVWQASRQASLDATESAHNYNTAVGEILTTTRTLKDAEGERLIILEKLHTKQVAVLKAQEQAEIAAAGGDKAKEAEIRARYGAKQSVEDAAAEAAVIAEQRRNLDAAKAAALEAASKARAAETARQQGPPGADAAAEAAAIADARSQKTPELQAKVNTLLNGMTLAELAAEAEREKKLPLPGGEQGAPQYFQMRYAAAKKAKADLEKNKAEIAAAQDTAKAFALQKTDLDKNASDALGDSRNKNADVLARENELTTAVKVQDINRRTRAVSANQTLIGRAALAVQEYDDYGRTSGDNSVALAQLAGQLKLKNSELKLLYQVLRDFLKDGVVTEEEGKQIRQAISQMRAQQNRHPQ